MKAEIIYWYNPISNKYFMDIHHDGKYITIEIDRETEYQLKCLEPEKYEPCNPFGNGERLRSIEK